MNAYAKPLPSPPARWLSVHLPQATQPARARYQSHVEDIVDRFRALVTRWRTETYYYSLADDKMDHPAFQQIVSMGDAAIPLVIQEIKSTPDTLVMALHFLTGEDPVSPTAQGKLDEIINCWLTWAERQKAYAA